MGMNYILDLVLIAVITASVLIGKRRGFLKSSYNILSFIITAVLILTMSDPFCAYLSASPLGDTVRGRVSEKVGASADKQEEDIRDSEDAETAVKVGQMMGLPDFLMKFLDDKLEKQTEAVETMKNNALDTLTDAVSEMIIKIASIILLFVLVRVGVFLLLKLLELLFSMPGLNSINAFFGMLAGAVNGLLIVYIICAVLTLLVPAANVSAIAQASDKSVLFKYFYNNNLLIELFI